jgi:hypothetical protein
VINFACALCLLWKLSISLMDLARDPFVIVNDINKNHLCDSTYFFWDKYGL